MRQFALMALLICCLPAAAEVRSSDFTDPCRFTPTDYRETQLLFAACAARNKSSRSLSIWLKNLSKQDFRSKTYAFCRWIPLANHLLPSLCVIGALQKNALSSSSPTWMLSLPPKATGGEIHSH